jgi:hypothetical protein
MRSLAQTLHDSGDQGPDTTIDDGPAVRFVGARRARSTLSHAIRGRARSAREYLPARLLQYTHLSTRCSDTPCSRCLRQELSRAQACVIEVNRSHSEVAYDIAHALGALGVRVFLAVNVLALRERGRPSQSDLGENVSLRYFQRRVFRRIARQVARSSLAPVISSSSVDYWKRSDAVIPGLLLGIERNSPIITVRHSRLEAITGGEGPEGTIHLSMEDWPGQDRTRNIAYRPTFPNRGISHPRNRLSVVVVGSIGRDLQPHVDAATSLRSASVTVHMVGPSQQAMSRSLRIRELPPNLVLHGALDDADLFSLIEASGYVIGPTSLEGYFQDRVSGARQLALGLNRPLIVHPALAEEWHLHPDCYISARSVSEGVQAVVDESSSMYQARVAAMHRAQRSFRESNLHVLRGVRARSRVAWR